MDFRHKILLLATAPMLLAMLAVTMLVTTQSAELSRASLHTFEDTMLRAKQEELLNLTRIALSAIEPVYGRAGQDDLEAQRHVRTILSDLSYGLDGYFFVYDYNGNSIVHPRQSYRLGQNFLSLEDIDGTKVIFELVQLARTGGGLLQYKWEQPSTGQIADKLSFAVGLDKWEWMLGTGVYLNDVAAFAEASRQEITQTVNRSFLAAAVLTIPLIAGVFITWLGMTISEKRLADKRLRSLARQLISAQEAERARISRELHDGVSQTVIAARYLLDAASTMSSVGDPGFHDYLRRSANGLNSVVNEIRRISHDLRPGLLDDLGLAHALDALLTAFSERTGIATNIEATADLNAISPESKTALYRIAQEALTNVERHSSAKNVCFRICENGRGTEMIIADDGCCRSAPPKGLGIRNMSERADQLGGRFTVGFGPTGVTLKVWLPKFGAMAA